MEHIKRLTKKRKKDVKGMAPPNPIEICKTHCEGGYAAPDKTCVSGGADC